MKQNQTTVQLSYNHRNGLVAIGLPGANDCGEFVIEEFNALFVFHASGEKYFKWIYSAENIPTELFRERDSVRIIRRCPDCTIDIVLSAADIKALAQFIIKTGQDNIASIADF